MRSLIVIGAGPAGSLASVLAARAGWSVTLVEQQNFPRDKVCGECLSALGLEVLDRAGLLNRLERAGMVPLRRAIIWSTAGQALSLPLGRAMAGLTRAALDTALRDAAIEAGARILQPARCEAIVAGNVPSIRFRHLTSNVVEKMEADVIIVADGKGAITAGMVRPVNGDLGVKSHWSGVDGPADAIELFGLKGHYVGLARVESDRWNLAMSVPKQLVKSLRGNLDELLTRALEQNGEFARRLCRAARVSPWHSSPLPRYGVAPHWPMGIVPIGNAAAALEPIGGEGMGLALRSAELAIEQLSSPGRFNAGELQRRYRALWRERRTWCRLAAMIASRPRIADVAIVVGNTESDLAGWVAERMGKARLKERV